MKTHYCLQEAQPSPGPSEVGAERALAQGPDSQSFLPAALNPPNPLILLDPQCHASTHSENEEFLTCYRYLILHQTPLFLEDLLLSSLKGKQLQGTALTPAHLQVKQSLP